MAKKAAADDAEFDFDFLEMNFDEIEDAEERAAARESAADDDEETSEAPESESKFPFSLSGGAEKRLAKLAAKRAEAEASYVQAVAAALPAHKRARLAKRLSDPRVAPGWEGDRDPLALPAERAASREKPHVFVLNFSATCARRRRWRFARRSPRCSARRRRAVGTRWCWFSTPAAGP